MENKEVLEYRVRLINRFLEISKEFVTAYKAVRDPFIPLEEGGWNAHQVVAHVWDVDKHAYGMRVRRTIEEDEPVFPNYDGEDWLANVYDPNTSLESMLDEFMARIEEIIPILRALPVQSWNRIGRHETQGALTLQVWVERSLAHVEEHLATIRKGV